MANLRFEMYEYRQVITRMRSGDSDRAIAHSLNLPEPPLKESGTGMQPKMEFEAWLEDPFGTVNWEF